MIDGVTITNRTTGDVYQDTVDLQSTLYRIADGALIGGLGGGSAFGAVGGAAGAGLTSKMAGSLSDFSKCVASATGSDLIGNLAANIAAGVGGTVVGGTAGSAMASNVQLYNQSKDDERQLAGDTGKKSPSAFSLAMQGIVNGVNAIIGVGGGEPPMASLGVVLAESTVANGVSGTPGYVPDNATLASGGNNNRLPIPETVTADNGLQVESNPKHTPGMPGNRPNASTEPSDSLPLFNSSIQGGEKTRFAIDSDGNINRYYSDGNGVYHWTGSTGDSRAPIDVSTIPISVKRSPGFKGK
jgi:filamentous hemagglutinin